MHLITKMFMEKLLAAGWRPYIGWVCGFSLMYYCIVQPAMVFLFVVVSKYTGVAFVASEIPTMDTGPLMTVMMAMISMVGIRSYEKVKGVARSGDNKPVTQV